MKLKYAILVLFIFSVFSCAPTLQIKSSVADYLCKDIEWLMLKSEKEVLNQAKTDLERGEIIERFWQARDIDSSTAVNEFRRFYMERLKIVRKDYPDFNDPRRYIFLLFGQPNSKRTFSNERITIFDLFSITINTGGGEIWEYQIQGKAFQVIFIGINLCDYFRRNRTLQEAAMVDLSQNYYEILYLGIKQYNSIEDCVRDFLERGFKPRSTQDIINAQKSPILDRAKEFYKKREPEVREKNRKGKYSEGALKANILIDQFGFWLGEPRVHIWIVLDKHSLVRKKDDEYRAEISLYWELRDEDNQIVAYYQNDSVEYKLESQRNYCYSAWGSASPGKYRLILEIGENLGKKYKKVEVDIPFWGHSQSELQAEIIAGKVFREKQNWFKGKDFDPFSIQGTQFLPLSVLKFHYFRNEYYFRKKDEVAVFFNVSGFQRDHYGNPYLDLAVVFVDKQGKKFAYRFVPIRKIDNNIVERLLVLKIDDFINRLEADCGYYKIMLSIFDAIANESGSVVYSSGKKPYQMLIIKEQQNNR